MPDSAGSAARSTRRKRRFASRSTKQLADSERTHYFAFPHALPVEGGIPIAVDGAIIGAVGVGGTTSEGSADRCAPAIEELRKGARLVAMRPGRTRSIMSTPPTTESQPNAIVEQAVQQSRTFFDRQTDTWTTMLGERVTSIAADLRSMREQVAQNETASPAAGLIDQAAGYADQTAAYLRDADGERLLADAERLARSNPVLAAGVAALLGLSVARFVKASAHTRRSRQD
jgi:hypothetical protein